MNTRLMAMATTGFLAMAGSLEAAPPAAFALAAQTSRVMAYSRGQQVDARWVDDQVKHFEQLLGGSVAGPVSFIQYERPEEVGAVTGTYAAGITFAKAREIHTVKAAAPHEIVHLVAGQIGDPGAFFQEGLAVALTSGGQWYGRSIAKIVRGALRGEAPALPVLLARFESLDPQLAYPLAGSFVSYLIESHGLDQVVAFFSACRGRFDAVAFQRTFGRSLEEAGQAWTARI
jgi:hypothetical protein